MKKFCMDMHYLKIFVLLYALEWREDILTIFAALFEYLDSDFKKNQLTQS